MSEKQLTVTIDERVGVITLRRPPHNAFSSQLFSEMIERFMDMEKDDDIRAVIITGGLRNCFSSGADLDELFGEKTVSDINQGNYQGVIGAQDGFDYIEKYPKPVIAAIDGICIGAGLELSLCCDLRVASELSLFSLPEAPKMIIPVIGGTQRLTKLIGPGRAKEMLMLGKMIRAETALKWGLVNWVTTHRKVLSLAMEKARELVAIPARPLTAIKKLVYMAQEEKLEKGLNRELEEFVDLMKRKFLPENVRGDNGGK